MKPTILLPMVLIMSSWTGISLAQTKMIITVDGKESDLFGYSLEPSSGTPREISLFGPMQNAGTIFQTNFLAGKPISSVNISITDANTGTTIINLTDVSILSLRQYISTYSNGSFTISPGGNVNTEVKCKFDKIQIQSGLPKNNNALENINNITKPNEEKWVMSSSSIKGTLGKISVNFPDSIDFEIKIYGQTDNKYMGSFKKGSVILMLPGTYKVMISNAEVQNVTVQQGMDTRLKAGKLNMVSPTEYKLFDETKKNYLGSYKGPKKIGLPVGAYQLNIHGQYQVVHIKDGETVDF